MHTVVLASGVFDILHLGHIYYLENAKALGERLVVVIARDSTVELLKKKPFNDEQTRAKIVQALRCVDEVVLGASNFSSQFLDVVEAVKPSIIALGFDQCHDEVTLRERIQQYTGRIVSIIRLPRYDGRFAKTSKNIEDIFHYHRKTFSSGNSI